VAIADEDAGYGDGRAAVCHRGKKLLIAALIMHLPAHEAYSRNRGRSSTDLGQCAMLPDHCMPNAVTLLRQYSNGPFSNSQLAAARVGMRQPSTSR